MASAGAVTTVKLMSYNKNLRSPSEIGTPSTNARSKGRVTIEYTQGSCNNKMSFDIYKVWGNPAATTIPNTKYAPPIVGPDCWGADLITFSVDQVSSDNALDAIGFDQYYWRVLNGSGGDLFATPSPAFYTSADRSSITIDQNHSDFGLWLTGAPYKMEVCYGRANQWDGGASTSLTRLTTGVTCVTKTISPAAVAPTFTTTIPSCVATNITSLSPTPTYTALAGHTYAWTSTNGSWTLTPGTGSIGVSTMDGNPGTLILTVTGPCGSNVYPYPISRTFTSAQLTTIPTPIACLSVGNTVTVSTGTNSSLVPTCWTASPAGWSFVNNNGAQSSRTYTVPPGTCAGTYTFSARSCACTSVTSTVTVRVRPVTPTLTGPTCVPSGGGAVQNYTSTAPCGATSYTWSNTMGMTGSSTTNTIGYTPNGTANGIVQVIANGATTCPSLPATLSVGRNAVAPTITQPSCLNSGMATVGAVYTSTSSNTTWSFPAGLTASTPGVGSTATINVLGTPGTYACTATVNAPPCAPAVTNFNVVVPAFTYTVTADNISIPGSSLVYANFVPGTLYQLWNCSTNTPIGTFVTSSSFQLTNPGAGSYSITIDPPGAGCLQRPACVSTTYSAMPIQGDGTHVTDVLKSTDDIRIFPNPNTGEFTVQVGKEIGEGSMQLLDAKGARAGSSQKLISGENVLRQSGLSAGVYQLRLELDGAVEYRSIVIIQEQ